MTPQQKARIAAFMAVSNMGHLHNLDLDIVTDMRYAGTSSHDEVCHLAGHLMENDDHELMFAEEAEGWEKVIETTPDFFERYRHHKPIFDKIMSPAK